MVPSIGGRYHIIPQLAVYTTYIPLRYCLLGDYITPIPPIKGTSGNSIDWKDVFTNFKNAMAPELILGRSSQHLRVGGGNGCEKHPSSRKTFLNLGSCSEREYINGEIDSKDFKEKLFLSFFYALKGVLDLTKKPMMARTCNLSFVG